MSIESFLSLQYSSIDNSDYGVLLLLLLLLLLRSPLPTIIEERGFWKISLASTERAAGRVLALSLLLPATAFTIELSLLSLLL